MVGYGGSSASSYLADPTFPIPSHCALIVATSTLRVNYYRSALPDTSMDITDLLFKSRGGGGGMGSELPECSSHDDRDSHRQCLELRNNTQKKKAVKQSAQTVIYSLYDWKHILPSSVKPVNQFLENNTIIGGFTMLTRCLSKGQLARSRYMQY